MNDPTILVLGESALGGQRFPLREGRTMIGRGDQSDIQLYDDLISRRHAVVTRAEDRLIIEDVGSANGTFVNGEPITGRRDLRPGDVIRLGRTELLIAGGDPAETRLMSAVPPLQANSGPIFMGDPAATTRPAMQSTPDTTGGGAAAKARSPLSARSLILDAASAAITALALSALKVPEAGTAGGAALASLVTAFVQTPGRGQVPRILAAAALAWVISATGITLPEIPLGHALADAERPSTYLPEQIAPNPRPRPNPHPRPDPTRTTSPTTGSEGPSHVWEPQSLDCGAAPVNSTVDCNGEITITSTGAVPLQIRDVDQSSEFFIVEDGCTGRELPNGDSCVMRVGFAPAEEGPRNATLVIHQNIPPPDTGSPVEVTGTGLAEASEPE